jgi:hypothetical protein
MDLTQPNIVEVSKEHILERSKRLPSENAQGHHLLHHEVQWPLQVQAVLVYALVIAFLQASSHITLVQVMLLKST